MQAPLITPRGKRLVVVAGAIVSAIAIAYLVFRGASIAAALGDRLGRMSVQRFAAALALYSFGAAGLALAWAFAVRLLSTASLPLRPFAASHLKAQIGKYLPGNVFHFAYRHLAAHRAGVGHGRLGGALALESLLLLACASALAIGVVADPRVSQVSPYAHHIVFAAPVLAIGLVALVVTNGHRFGITFVGRTRVGATLAVVAVLDTLFFLLAAASLRMLSEAPNVLPIQAWCGWLCLAWVAGYVTPGAPAGIGVREAVLALGLGPVLGEAEALALATLYRLVTVASDAVLAAGGFLAARD